MGKLTTHVLDTVQGMPAAGMTIDLYRVADDSRQHLGSYSTNKDGRVDQPLLDNDSIRKGCYELVFQVESYFNSRNLQSSFLKDVIIRFFIENADEAYHVPLIVTPWSYSTYRGS